jgi:phage FluMu protein Com
LPRVLDKERSAEQEHVLHKYRRGKTHLKQRGIGSEDGNGFQGEKALTARRTGVQAEQSEQNSLQKPQRVAELNETTKRINHTTQRRKRARIEEKRVFTRPARVAIKQQRNYGKKS